jgi:outer membrane protein insertion porin family
MIINKKMYKTLLIIFFLMFVAATQVYAQEIKKIAIMPFDIYSKGDNASLRKALYQNLSDELKKEKIIQLLPTDSLLSNTAKIDEKSVIATGKSLGADFVIMGSLTQFGETISIDAKVIDVNTAKVLPSITVTGKGIASLSSIAAQLKIECLTKANLIQKVARIDIKGNRKIEALAIIQQIKTKAGKPFWEADITADIKTIYKMGFFQNVTVEATETAEGKVITFTVQEKGLISEIRIKGNKALDKDAIDEVLTIKTRQVLNQEKIKSDIEKLKTLYDSKGYYNAEITDTVEKDGEKDFRIILDIKENDRLNIKTITFEGNEAYTTKELKNMMVSSEHAFWHIVSDSDVLKREQLKQDVGKLAAYYYNNGFINAQIGEPEITHDKKWIYVKIKIAEGKRYKVGKVAISGDLLEKPRIDLFQSIKSKEGNNYDREAVMKDIEILNQNCNDEGYANSDVVPKVNIREKEQLVDVDYNIVKGELVFLNRISITGNTITRDKVIRRQLQLFEGDLYSSSKLKASYNNLNRLHYFEEVDFQTEKGPDKSKQDVNIRVKEKNTGMFMIGAGYGAVEGPIIMGQISQQNFLGRGQILSLKTSLGNTIHNYDISFTEPWLFDLPLYFQFNIWDYTTIYDSYTLTALGTGVTFGYPIWEKIGGSIGYRISVDDYNSVLDTAPWYIKGQVGPDDPTVISPPGKTITSAVTFALGRNTTDDNIYPTKGTVINLSIEQAGGILGGDGYFTKYGASIFAYQSLPLDMVLAAKGRMGFIDGHTNKTFPYNVPLYDRYVLGGLNSIRGLQYLGIRNSGDMDALGGTSMLVFNIEATFPLIKEAGIRGVIFFDTGNTWEGGYNNNYLRKTMGGGIRWYSPIGPLRLEYGQVLDHQEGESPGRWEFSLGMTM